MKARSPKPILSDLSNRLALTVPEAAEVLGLNPATVRNRIYAGELPATKMGRSMVILVAALKLYLRENTVWPNNPDWAGKVEEQAQEPRYGLHLVEKGA